MVVGLGVFPGEAVPTMRRMHKYCQRQVFYVAATHVGFRNEARQLIERSPRSVKKFWWLPHWF